MAKRRRGAGEGSIYKYRNGWAAHVTVGTDEAGRQRRRVVYAATRAEVVAKLDEERALAARGAADTRALKVGDYLKAWLDDVAAQRVRPGTLDVYALALRPVREELGGVALRRLSPLHLQALLRRLEERGASARARQMTVTYLKTALRDAVRMRLLPSSPGDAVDRPRAPRPEIRHLDARQVRALLVAAAHDPLEALYATAVGTGLRLGELLGLKWCDLDLDAGTLHVRRALVEEVRTGRRTLAEPKTKHARRKVDLPAFVVAALRRHHARLGATPHPERLVFTSPQGEPVRRSNLHRRSWKPLLKRAKLPDVPFHALRHTAATLALEAGVNPKVVQERLGHARIALTLDTYSASVPTLGRDAADRLEALIGRKG